MTTQITSILEKKIERTVEEMLIAGVAELEIFDQKGFFIVSADVEKCSIPGAEMFTDFKKDGKHFRVFVLI